MDARTSKVASSPEMERKSPKVYDKKKEGEIQLIASLPKPQSLPAHQLFKDKRKVFQVMCAVTLLTGFFMLLLTLNVNSHVCYRLVTDRGKIEKT